MNKARRTRFKLYHDNGETFCRVYIWPSVRDMIAFLEKIHCQGERGAYADTAAIHRGFEIIHTDPRGGNRWTHEIGEVHFPSRWCRAGIMAHELAHAAHHYMRLRRKYGLDASGPTRRGIRIPKHAEASEREEMFCWVLGNLVRQFCLCYYGLKNSRLDKFPWPRKLHHARNKHRP